MRPVGSAGPRCTSANSRLRQGPGNGSARGPRPRLPGQGLQKLSWTASPQDVPAGRAREAWSGRGLLMAAGEPLTRVGTCSPARCKPTRRQKPWGWQEGAVPSVPIRLPSVTLTGLRGATRKDAEGQSRSGARQERCRPRPQDRASWKTRAGAKGALTAGKRTVWATPASNSPGAPQQPLPAPETAAPLRKSHCQEPRDTRTWPSECPVGLLALVLLSYGSFNKDPPITA